MECRKSCWLGYVSTFKHTNLVLALGTSLKIHPSLVLIRGIGVFFKNFHISLILVLSPRLSVFLGQFFLFNKTCSLHIETIFYVFLILLASLSAGLSLVLQNLKPYTFSFYTFKIQEPSGQIWKSSLPSCACYTLLKTGYCISTKFFNNLKLRIA